MGAWWDFFGRWFNPYNGCPENRYIVTTDPKPNDGDINAGVKVSSATACSKCDLKVDGNLSSSTAELRSFSWAGAPGKAESYSMETKAYLLPSLPFSVTFNGVAESYPIIEIYRPSPVRIENIQHDAVIQIGNFFNNNIIILVPVISANMIQSGGSSFVGAFASQVANVIAQPQDASGNPLPMNYPNIPTGSDWTLDKILDASAPYFTWTSSQYQQGVVSANRCGMRMGWHAIPPGQRIILMQNPISIAPAYMAQIQRLPPTNPSFAIHGIGPVAYKGAPPKDCAPPKSALPSVPNIPDPISQLQSNAKNQNNTLDLVLKIVLGIIGSLAVVIGVYFGLKFGMGPGGKILAKLGESLGQKMAQAGAAAQVAAKNARAGIANTAGIGKTGAFPAKRTPIDDESPLPTSEDAKAAIAAAPELNPDFKEPTGVFGMNSPMFQNKVSDDKKKLRRTTARRSFDDSPLPADNDGVIPALAASNPPALSPEETERRRKAEQYRKNNPAGTGLFDLGDSTNTPSPLPEPNESITVPTLPPHLRPRKGRNGTIRRPLRELPPFEDSPIPTPAEVDSAITPTTAQDLASLDRPFVEPPTLSPEERKEMDLLDGSIPAPPPPGTHGLWRNGVSLSNLRREDDGPLPAANEPVVPTRRAMTINPDAARLRQAALDAERKDDSPLPSPSESNRSLASVASVASRLSRRASRAREAASDFDLAVERTPTRPKTPEPALAPPLPEGNELDNLTSSTGLERSITRARDINPNTGFTNSLGAKFRTADAFSNSLQRVRARQGENDRSMTGQELASIGAPKRTRAEKLALRKEGKKAGRRKTGRRNI